MLIGAQDINSVQKSVFAVYCYNGVTLNSVIIQVCRMYIQYNVMRLNTLLGFTLALVSAFQVQLEPTLCLKG